MVIKTKILYNEKLDGVNISIRCHYDIIKNNIHILTFHRIHDYRHSKQKNKYNINKGMSACKLLKQHTIDLKNDPERLSTEFLQNMIYGIRIND